MAFGRFLAYRLIVTVAVLLTTVLLTMIVLGPTMDNILRRSVEQEVRASIYGNPQTLTRFRDPKELEAYILSRIEVTIKDLGLDEPWHSPRRLWFVVLRVMSLDLGQSFYLRSYGGSSLVRDIIMEALPRTILLFTSATIISSVIGIFLGLIMARRAGSAF